MAKLSKTRIIGDEIAYFVLCALLPVIGLVLLVGVPILGILFCLTVGYFGAKLIGYTVGTALFLAFLVAIPGGALVMPSIMRSIYRVAAGFPKEVARLDHERWLRKSELADNVTGNEGSSNGSRAR
jgi:hypothetical protein